MLTVCNGTYYYTVTLIFFLNGCKIHVVQSVFSKSMTLN